MKVDIQTQLQRISIAEISFSNVSLVHKQQVGQIFSHEINELGQHILVCSVSYIGGNEEKLNLRKFFKFSVNKPVDLLNQTFYELNDKTTFYEFQIKNLTPNPIFIESLAFEDCGNNLPYNCELTGSPSLNTDSEPLGLQNIHQYIFRLTHNEQFDAENWRKILNFGRLKIVWRSTTGDNGRTFFNTIERSQFICKDLRLTVDRAPKKAKVNGMLTVVCNLRNWSDHPMDLLLNFDQNVGPIIHCSVSGQRLPTILPGHNIQISFEILPYVKGLQSISGVFLTDLLLKRTFEFNNIFDIFIE
uniref:Uncharacterized protein n=1 Tax=Meloidogyne incognita TaxID=6306 RepID=A0A914LTU8_MELIC